MAPLHSTAATHVLAKRQVNLSTGAIAGIIVGIVVVSLLLLALLIWRLLAYRKNLDPYSARSLDTRARTKALSQTRGGQHVRSTRPRDRDMRTRSPEEGRSRSFFTGGNKQQHQSGGPFDDDEPLRQPSSRRFESDAQSTNATVRNDSSLRNPQRQQQNQSRNHLLPLTSSDPSKEKQSQQEHDFEIYQGHHAGPAPATQLDQSHFSQDNASMANLEPTRSNNEKKEQRQSALRGCTTM